MRENPILVRLCRQTGQLPRQLDPLWLFTLHTVSPIARYTLADWNEALSAVLGRRIFCPSYRILAQRLQEECLSHPSIS